MVRAIERGSSSAVERRALFVVPSAYAPDEGVVDRLPDGGGFVVERRGLCTLHELVEVTALQTAFLDIDVAVDLIVRAGRKAGDVFDLDRIEICDDGAIVAFAGQVRVDDARTVMDALSLLVCDSLDPDRVVETLSQRHSAATLRTFVARAPSWSVGAFCKRLAELIVDKAPPPSLLGQTVAALFPERLAEERTFDEQVAMLDDAALAELAGAATTGRRRS